MTISKPEPQSDGTFVYTGKISDLYEMVVEAAKLGLDEEVANSYIEQLKKQC